MSGNIYIEHVFPLVYAFYRDLLDQACWPFVAVTWHAFSKWIKV